MNRQLTMLIVDDMEVERISFAEIFKDEYQILEAENGKQAKEQLEQQKVHIVLLDLCMPVMDGFEVIREMKQQDKYADIPIVAKTAIDEKTEVKALEAGADEYIFSPCDPAIVKKRVHNLVEKYILEREKIRAQLEKEQEMGRAKELFQIEVGRVRNENIGKIADCFLNIGMIQMCIWEVRHDQIHFSLL